VQGAERPEFPRPSGTVAGTTDVTGEPGVESALGRDRAQGELPATLGTNTGPGSWDRPIGGGRHGAVGAPARAVADQAKARGWDLVGRARSLAREALVRRISVRRGGSTLVEFPLALGIGGALLVPKLTVVGALAGLVADCTVTVVRAEDPPPDPP
jgi:hypothetical protein